MTLERFEWLEIRDDSNRRVRQEIGAPEAIVGNPLYLHIYGRRGLCIGR